MTQDPKLVHDTIRVTKVIIDTVRMPSRDSMDLLNKMDSFYNNAWTKLIMVVTIAFAIIGIVMPILIQWYQKRELKLSEDKLKDDIAKAITTATDDFTKYVDEQVQKKFDELNKRVSKHVANLDGKAFHLQGGILHNEASYFSLGSYFVALSSYVKADEPVNLKKVLKFLVSEEYQLETFNKDKIEKAFERYDADYKKILNDIKERFDDSEIKELCGKLETIMDSLV